MKIEYSLGIIIVLFSTFALNLQAQQKEDFINACKTGNMKVVKRTVKDKFDLNSEVIEDGTTGLMIAAAHGQRNVIKYLIEKGADVNRPNDFDYTPLMISIQQNHVEAVRFLIEKGADVNAQNKLNETPFIFAVEACNAEIVNLLIEKDAQINIKTKIGQKPLLIAATKGCKEIVEILLQNGIEVDDASEIDSTTALMKAAKYGHFDLVKMLLEKGAQINKRNRHGNTALMFAVQNNQTEIVKQLLEAGSDINDKNILGYTPLLYALDYNQTDLVKYLIEKGADVNVETKNDLSPLKIVQKAKDSVMVAFLIEKGAIEKVEKKKETTKADRNIIAEKSIEQLKEASIKDDIKEILIHAQIDETGTTKYAKIIYSSTEDSLFDKTAYDTFLKKKWSKDKNKKKNMAAWKFYSIKYDENFSETKSINDSTIVEISNIKTDLADMPLQEPDDQIRFIPYDEPPTPIGGFAAIQRALRYPEIARKAGIEGKVIIYAKIGTDGKVVDTKVIKPLGNSGCNEAAIEAIKKVMWEPASQKNKPVTVWVSVPVQFKLGGGKKSTNENYQEKENEELAIDRKDETNSKRTKKIQSEKNEEKRKDISENRASNSNTKLTKAEKENSRKQENNNEVSASNKNKNNQPVEQKQKSKNDTTKTTQKEKQYDVSPQPVDGFDKIQANLEIPKIVKDGKISGTVVINVKVSEKGKILKTTFVKLLMNKKCNAAALNAIKSVKWKPATKDNKPITADVDVPIEFKKE